MSGFPAANPQDRFLRHVVPAWGGCWAWTANLNHEGYGRFWMSTGTRQAHAWAYENWNGAIPAGMQIDHLCRNRRCVNPQHLEAVTPRENVMRGNTVASVNASKTRCPEDHALSGDNLYVSPRGDRGCRKCRAAASARYFRRK